MSDVAYRPRYRISDYLKWEGDWELWDGQAVAMSPSPNKSHQNIGRRLVVHLDQALRDAGCHECQLYYEIDWHVDEFTVVRPDVLVVCADAPGDFVTTAPSFIAEILSPSTATKDLTAKRALYQSQGVGYYLIIDPKTDRSELLALGPDRQYAAVEIGSEMELHPGYKIRLDRTELP